MSVLGNSQLLMTPEGYQISRSVRLRSSASAYFNRTPASAGNRTTWTMSAWVKRGRLGVLQAMFCAGANASARGLIEFETADTIRVGFNDGASWYLASTSAVFRDPSAWYHVVVAFDLTNGTNANRVKLYVNNNLQTFASTPTWSTSSQVFNNNVSHVLGSYYSPYTDGLDGYLTEVNFIDGQALTPSSFGETDVLTGVWKPKKYAGTYGTNGFYLNFSDNSGATATTIGKDYSGNGNNWTPNNISVTAGVTYDSMIDVPTLYADGGNGRGNYAVMNPLNNPAAATFADGNLKVTNASTNYRGALSTMAIPSSGKWYWEIQSNATTGVSSIVNMGIAPLDIPLSGNQNGYTNSAAWYLGNAVTYWMTGGTSIGASSTSDVFQVAYDAATGKVWLGRNNVWYWGSTTTNNTTGDPAGGSNPSFTLTPTEFYAWAFAYVNGFIANFGQRPFAYTPPTGFKALNTQNLPEPTIKKANQYFDVSKWTGNGGTQSITGLAFQPDLVWAKDRSAANFHALYDAVRGTTKVLQSNTTTAEQTFATGLTSFNSNGFTTGSNSDTNTNGNSYVAWQWKESASAGFDIVTYTGTGANRTVAHNLGVAPSLMILKCRSTTYHWPVYHRSIGPVNLGFLNLTNAYASSPTTWNSTNPTSTEFSLGTDATSNANGQTFVMYLWAEVAGFSKFGSYTGNGSADGPFVYCGFRPAYVMVKRTDGVSNWNMADNKRPAYNPENEVLIANGSNATLSSYPVDFTANGFKVRNTEGGYNTSSGTYIYMAFAEHPFKNALAR